MAQDLPRGPGRPTKDEAELRALARRMATSYKALGGIIRTLAMVIPDQRLRRHVQATGAAIVANANTCGIALAQWADTDPKVKKWLTKGSRFTALGAVLDAHSEIIGAALTGDVEAGALIADMMGAMGSMGGDSPFPSAQGPMDDEAAQRAFTEAFAATMFGGIDGSPQPAAD
jgi:hypothetical protein